ncbi:hypothetical protein F4678DRAFT_433773 [Xylaria arbuscula]|nr:hypothetical protein F4678DRAFT_433773 [Xylaria arbuscula]
MVCQTRSRAKQRAEQQVEQPRSIRQTRSRTKQQHITGTTAHTTDQSTVERADQRILGAVEDALKGQSRKRAPKQAPEYPEPPQKQPRKSAPKGTTTFNLLPTEIRLMVWEEFVRTPRIIRVDTLNPTKPGRGLTCHFPSQYGKVEQVCPLLGVNRESRYVALKEEPFIHFDITIPLFPRRRFHKHTITRRFAIRSRDILFIDGSDSWTARHLWTSRGSQTIANVMIDLDASPINYERGSLGPGWSEVFQDAEAICWTFRNWDHLQNLYCLMRDPETDKSRPFELDDIHTLTASRFPKQKKALERWLYEFSKYPQTSIGVGTYTSPEWATMKKAWKNVSLGR